MNSGIKISYIKYCSDANLNIASVLNMHEKFGEVGNYEGFISAARLDAMQITTPERAELLVNMLNRIDSTFNYWSDFGLIYRFQKDSRSLPNYDIWSWEVYGILGMNLSFESLVWFVSTLNEVAEKGYFEIYFDMSFGFKI